MADARVVAEWADHSLAGALRSEFRAGLTTLWRYANAFEMVRFERTSYIRRGGSRQQTSPAEFTLEVAFLISDPP